MVSSSRAMAAGTCDPIGIGDPAGRRSILRPRARALGPQGISQSRANGGNNGTATAGRLTRFSPSQPAQTGSRKVGIDGAHASQIRLRRYSVGVRPAALRKAAVNELVVLKPSAKPISVTEHGGLANNILACSMRRLL
jgi:hypothetical protein